ncbi:TRAP transporter small permease subunit [Colwellia sp. 20A7]|uniref:TRAP transporter small permease subunit n=1 Tax=Colwellia sp. 20A7 TaxID=2689569 RepID=UPI001915EF9F|nr:TRAP transporter small permease subunit [Colwellia sp. 20A7]
MKTLLNILEKFIDAVGSLCSLLMILMILNVFYDVLMRYFFNDVSIAMQELEWHLYAAMFMFGIGYTLKEDGHVRVDVIYDQLSKKSQAIINIAGSLLFALPFTLLILYFSWDYALEAYTMGEGSADPWGLPHRWIIRSVIPVSSIYLLVCLLYVVLTQIKSLSTLVPEKGEK